MNFSNTYLFYPDNRTLERAIANSILVLGEEFAEAATPDTKVTVADNFLHTRGNYEQRRFSSNILESAREALQVSLTDGYRIRRLLPGRRLRIVLETLLRHWGSNREMLNYSKRPLSVLAMRWKCLTRKSHRSTGLQPNITWELHSKLLADNSLTRNY